MHLKSKITAGLAGAAFAALATVAVAGTAVYGYGDSRAEAVRDAERNVKQESLSRFDRADCYSPIRPEDCRQDSSGWVCVAYVANHRGSCGR